MKIIKITATQNQILLELDQTPAQPVTVTASVALTCGDPNADFTLGRTIFTAVVSAQNQVLTISRYENDYDLLICRFQVSDEAGKIPGVSFVTDFSEDFSRYNYDYPTVKRPIGTWVSATPEDMDYLRFGYMMNELDQAWMMTVHPKEDDIPHVFNGQTYYFQKEIFDEIDRNMRATAERKVPCLIRFINRYLYRLREGDPDLFRIIKHPGYESDFRGVEMSAVNLRTEEGLNFYCACMDYLFSRYCDPDSPNGWSIMMDVGNEINSQQIWHNAGPMSLEGFMEEYTVSLRLAWLLSRKYYAHHRINISLEQNFTTPHIEDDQHYYSARDCLVQLARCCHRDGDFDWGVAAHPYPENLSYPDFYNDRSATFSFNARKITMKNMEVWPAFLGLPEFLYRGKPRHIIFDEQGFNTRDADPYTEEQGAYAFVLAYLKMRNNPNIDLMLIHRYVDIPFNEEYGLNLGLRRCLGYADDLHLITIPGPHKMICDAIRAMDSPREEAWVRAARNYIGPALFDAVLNPPEIDKGDLSALITNFDV